MGGTTRPMAGLRTPVFFAENSRQTYPDLLRIPDWVGTYRCFHPFKRRLPCVRTPGPSISPIAANARRRAIAVARPRQCDLRAHARRRALSRSQPSRSNRTLTRRRCPASRASASRSRSPVDPSACGPRFPHRPSGRMSAAIILGYLAGVEAAMAVRGSVSGRGGVNAPSSAWPRNRCFTCGHGQRRS